MLILSRKKNEQIVIADNITVTVLEIDGDKIKLGIDAPNDVKVFRKELIEEVKHTNAESTGATVSLMEELKAKMKNK